MLYNFTDVYVVNNQIVYVKEGEISRNSAEFNVLRVLSPLGGFGVSINFKLPNGVFTNALHLIQQDDKVSTPAGISELNAFADEEWTVYQRTIPLSVLSAISANLSQALQFSVRFTREFVDEVFDIETEQTEEVTKVQTFTTEVGTLALQGTVDGEPSPIEADDAQFLATKINEVINNLNILADVVSDETTGLDTKLSKLGDAMIGVLETAPSSGQVPFTLEVKGDSKYFDGKLQDVGEIDGHTFDLGDVSSDIVRYNELAQVLDIQLGSAPLTTSLKEALDARFDQYLLIAEEITQLNDLFDVELSGLSSNDLLIYNGTKWANRKLAEGDIPNLPQNKITNLGTALGDINSEITDIKQDFMAKDDYLDGNDKIKLENLPDTALQPTLVFQTTNEFDTFDTSGVIAGTKAFDNEAKKAYIWDGTEWLLTADADWENINLDWANIANAPKSAANTTLKDGNVYTTAEADNKFEQIANIGNRNYTENNVVTNEDTITQSIDDIDIKLGVVDGELDDKMDKDGSNSEIDELSFENKVDNTRISKIFVEGCCIKYQHDDGLEIRLGKELVYRNFKNTSGSTISKGTPVMFAGVQGDNTLVRPADVTSSPFNLQDFPQAFLGLASQNIAPNEFGGITWFGDVEDIIVTSKGGETWLAGSVLYFDPTDGGLTTVRPNGEAPEIIVGFIRRLSSAPSAENGKIFVRPTIYPRLKDLMGVRETDIQDNEAFVYDAGLGFFVNKEIVLSNDLFINGKIKADLIPFQFEDVLQGFFDGTDFYEEDTFDTLIEAAEGKLYIDLASNDLYRFDGVEYIIVKEAIGLLEEITNVDATGLADGRFLQYNATDSKWEIVELPTINELNDVGDVDITTPTSRQALMYNSTSEKWENKTLTTSDIDYALNDLTNVTAPSPSTDDVLAFDGSAWGTLGKASQADAETGTVNDKYMTPLRTAQLINQATIDGGEFPNE